MSEQEELATGGVIEPGGIPYVSDDPGPEVVFLPRNATVAPREPMKFVMLSGDSAREYIREEVHKALYGETDGIVSAHEHRRVEMHEQDGSVWRGVLYRVQEHANG